MFSLVVLVAGAIFFFKVGDTEFDGRGWLFVAVSVLASLAAIFLIPRGLLGVALSQVALLIVITIFKTFSGYKPRM